MMNNNKATNLLSSKGYETKGVYQFVDLDNAKLAIQLRAYLSMSQKDHICYGTSQCGTQFQNPCYSACITLLLQASQAHMHLVAKKSYKIKHIHP